MAGKGKKVAAALAAVGLYLQQEEAAAGEQQIPVRKPKPQGIEFSAWGQSGRQDVMTMRRLIQMRVFTRF